MQHNLVCAGLTLVALPRLSSMKVYENAKMYGKDGELLCHTGEACTCTAVCWGFLWEHRNICPVSQQREIEQLAWMSPPSLDHLRTTPMQTSASWSGI